jgi:hypothetical protein
LRLVTHHVKAALILHGANGQVCEAQYGAVVVSIAIDVLTFRMLGVDQQNT